MCFKALSSFWSLLLKEIRKKNSELLSSGYFLHLFLLFSFFSLLLLCFLSFFLSSFFFFTLILSYLILLFYILLLFFHSFFLSSSLHKLSKCVVYSTVYVTLETFHRILKEKLKIRDFERLFQGILKEDLFYFFSKIIFFRNFYFRYTLLMYGIQPVL